jgi:hypothetical protein
MLMTSSRTDGIHEGYDEQVKTQRFRFVLPVALAFALGILLAGCSASSSTRGEWTGPTAASPVKLLSWDANRQQGKILETAHYQVHTTITDEDVLARLPQVLEGAYTQYQMFATAPQSNKPMKCYVFAKRSEWADFTARNTGQDAAVYLQITRGGYCIGDWFVSYYVGDTATFSVAAHEGWHQYVARHFKGRLPPFLEEGTACMFESVRFPGDLPRWDLSLNPNRTHGLRNAMEGKVLWPLEKLVRMHAGDVVQLPGDKIEAFYAQNWAFARFLWEYDNGRYRPAFKKLLGDTAAGNVWDPTGTLHRAQGAWSPSSVKPMLEHYLGKSLADVEKEYVKFMKDIAYTQFGRQWMTKPG